MDDRSAYICLRMATSVLGWVVYRVFLVVSRYFEAIKEATQLYLFLNYTPNHLRYT